MQYSAKLEGDEIACIITADRDLPAPVFCFSGMAPMTATAGGHRVAGLGSFTEVALPDLKAHHPHQITLAYTGGYTPANRAWLPLGPYLRVGRHTIALPQLADAGRRPQIWSDHGPAPDLPLVPQPTNWAPTGARSDIIGVATDHPALAPVSALAKRRNLQWQGETPITYETSQHPTDGYTLTIATDCIHIAASDDGGVFYAGITLLNLLQFGPLPCGQITDRPRFAWRGQQLDTARHYYDPQTITDLLDVMALLKLNRFHWHFADDEAFRLEIDCLPELWQKTRRCGEGEMLPALFAGDISAGGSYPKKTAKNIIAHAAALRIEVMPEIETPAHATALSRVFPQMRDPADNGAETSVQGYPANAVNPAMPETWRILDMIISEVAEIFPFDVLHLGCDELPKGTWLGSPKARALMTAEALQDTDDLQGWMMERLAQTVVSKGKRPAAWEEAARGRNGGIGHNALLFSWTGQGPGLDAARAGYDVVMTPAQHTYFDMAHTDDPDDWGASWAGFVDLPDTVNWNPVPNPALSDRIVGVQGAFWSEFTTQDAQLWPMILPRLFGLASMAWQATPPTGKTLSALSATHFLTAASMTRPSNLR